MERKKIIEIIIAVLVLLGLIWFVLWTITIGNVEEDTLDAQEASNTLPSTPNTPLTVSSVDASTEGVGLKPTRTTASTVARTFVERIGSYSSESDYQNVEDVMGLVTANLATTLEKDAEKARAKTPTEEGGYYGISTSYIGAKTVTESDTGITLLVQTQREESFGSPDNTSVRYQSVTLVLVEEEGAWKVSAYTWED